MAFLQRAAEIWRDFNTALNPLSGAHPPAKTEIRAWGKTVEDSIEGLSAAAGFDPTIVAAISQRVTDETAARSAGDTGLGQRIDGILTRRQSGDGLAFGYGDGNLLIHVQPNRIWHPAMQAVEDAVANLAANPAGGGGPDASYLGSWSIATALSEELLSQFIGQSLSNGVNALPLISTSPLAYADMFAGGARPQDGGTDPGTIFGSLKPLVETADSTNGTGGGETPCSGAARMFFQLLAAENGVNLAAVSQRLLMAATGEGGKSMAYLTDPNNGPYQRCMNAISYGQNAAFGLGRTFEASTLNLVHGWSDYINGVPTPRATYKNGWRGFRSAAQARARTTTGIARTLPMFVSQDATHLLAGSAVPEIALAQLELCSEPEFCFVAPQHMLQYSGDKLHLGPRGSIILGAYHGLSMKRAMIDGKKTKQLVPEITQKSGNTILLNFPSAVGGLVFDTNTTPNPGNYGFTMVDPNGGNIPVAGVKLVGPRTVAVNSGSAVPAGSTVRAGWIGDGSRGLCNLRDRQGDNLVFDPGGINWPMHRWAPIFERTV